MNSEPTTAEHFRELRELVEQRLQQCVQGRDWPERLEEAVNYSLLAGGKRLRPLLVLLSAEVCGGGPAAALPAACAIEMIHTYSLIHDDLPAMDDDDLRRGRPTCHRVYGEALAILAGDALLTLAFETLAESGNSAQIVAAQVLALATAAGGGGMVVGQILDLDAQELRKNTREISSEAVGNTEDVNVVEADPAPGSDSDRICSSKTTASSVEHLNCIHSMKTGALIRAAMEIGALSAGAEVHQIRSLRRYGQCIGLAFQIADDLLDVTGDSSRLGKTTGRDEDLGKFTYPALLGQEASRSRAQAMVDEACASLQQFSVRGKHLQQLAKFIVERDH